MVALQVDTLTFTFGAAIADAQIYDKWVHYTTVWSAIESAAAKEPAATQRTLFE